jgi:hypothetical protein
MKYIKTYEKIIYLPDANEKEPLENLPLKESKFKIGDEVIFDPWLKMDNRAEVGKKYIIIDVFPSPRRFYYKMKDNNGEVINYLIPEKRLKFEWEYNANKYNL